MADYNSVHTGLNVDDAVAEVYGNNGIVSGNDGNGNFWTKYPDGTMHQCGITGDTEIAAPSATTTITFPEPFGLSCDSVTTTSSNRSDHTYSAHLGTNGIPHPLTTTGFTVLSDALASSAFGIYWQAFGRWKEPSSNIILSPASGVIESGGNDTDGYYTKFPDGTLMCWDEINGSSTTILWTFPIAFVSNPICNATIKLAEDADYSVNLWSVTTTNVTALRLINGSATSNGAPIHVIAIGRWK